MIRWKDEPWHRMGTGIVCPDLARLEYFGEADNLRGRIVRAFFWVLDRIMPLRERAG